MTPAQQRLHDQHKARLARIQNSAYRAQETVKSSPARPASTPVEKFNRTGGVSPAVGHGTARLEAGHAAPQVAPHVQGENAAPTTRTLKSATASSAASWFRVAGTHLTVRDIQEAVIAHFRMPHIELFAKRRNKATVRARHIAIYLSKILTIQSPPEIGLRFGGLDHTTILYASRKVERELPLDAVLAQDVAEIERALDVLEETRA